MAADVVPALKDAEPAETDDFGLLVLQASQKDEDDLDNHKPPAFDLVAVHGLHGHRTHTWTQAATGDASSTNWLEDQIHQRHPTSRIMTFGYNASDTKAGIVTRAGIRVKALQLVDELVKLRDISDPDKSCPLVFFAHDLGGMIVKEALCIASLEYSKYGSITDSTRLLIFFGSPHRCISTQDMEDQIAGFLFASENPRPVSAAWSIKELARSIIEINGFFAVSNMPSLLSIVNVYSEEEDTALQIFDRYTATLDVAFQEQIGCPRPHHDLCRLAESDNWYERIDEALSRYPSPLNPINESEECLQTLRLLVGPIYPLKSLRSPKHRFEWIGIHDSYTKWLNSYGPSILHIHGTTGASDAAADLFHCLDVYQRTTQADRILVYFSFNANDDRYNSVVAMLGTLLAQMIYHKQELVSVVEALFAQMSFHHSCTQAELWRIFQAVISDQSSVGVLCVLDGLDQCDDSWKAFLENLFSFVSRTEGFCKIAFTSTTDPDLQAALSNWPTINLDDSTEDPVTAKTLLASNVDREVLELMQQRPTLSEFEETITEKLFDCGQDGHLRSLVLNQFRLCENRAPTKSAIRHEMQLPAPTTSKDMFARILARVPSERRVWARRVLTWILYASRPLRVYELGAALALKVASSSIETVKFDDLVHEHLISDLDENFGGILVVKYNEVHFGHPDVRRFLLAADCDQEHVWYGVKKIAHYEITHACLLCLSLQQVWHSTAVNDKKPPNSPLELPNSHSRYDLREYAIKYWPRHYKLIPEALRPIDCVRDFVENTKAMRNWVEAYWSVSNSISRTDRTYFSLLPIFAGLGLQDLVQEWLDMDADLPEASQDRALALSEAARNANAEVIHTILSYGGYDQRSLQDALVAGASCCDEVVLNKLITYAAESIKGFEWPPAVLCRAAQFGLENVVSKLLESGASLDTAITLGDVTPLHCAARQGHSRVAKILLDHKADPTRLTTLGRIPLQLASMKGDERVVKVLLDAETEIDVAEDIKNDVTCLACLYGHYKVVGTLAETWYAVGCDSQGNWSPLIVLARNGFVKSAQVLLEKKANTEVEGWSDWTPLRWAANSGHVEFCSLLLDNGANANTLRGGAPILVETAKQGNIDIIKLLLRHDAVVDAVDPQGNTALQSASAKGYISIVACLLDHGADINHANETGETSIFLAAASSFAQLVQILIDRGADLHRATKLGWTPIHFSYDDAETTRVLMNNGAELNRVANGNTPLYLASDNNELEVVEVLLSFNPDLETQYTGDDGTNGYTALTTATVKSYTAIVRLLLEAGANINHRSDKNNVPLQYAVSNNDEDLVRTLMEYKPELDLIDNDGDTALNCIEQSTSLAIVKLLVNGGSSLETRNKDGNMALCQVVKSDNFDDNFEVVKYLISKKAELNVIGGEYGGPLHIACRWFKLELVKILVGAGADVTLVDPVQGTPLQSVCSSLDLGDDVEDHESVILYLVNEAQADITIVGGQQGCALNAACGWSTPAMVKLFLDKGAKIDVADGMGRIAIHFAAAKSLANFEQILNAGADMDARDKMGRTVLHWAAICGVVNVVERVISLSRDLVDQADNHGWTPLLWAARGGGTWQNGQATSNVQEEIIKVLLDRGADPCVRGKGIDRDWSPVKVARYHGLDDAIVQILMTKAMEKLANAGEADTWDEEFHASEKARRRQASCDSCLCAMYGIRYKCETCLNFDLCYKCYMSRDLGHVDHHFKPVGPEYVEAETHSTDLSEDDEDAEDGETDDDDDTDDDDTDDDVPEHEPAPDNDVSNENGSKDGTKQKGPEISREKGQEDADEDSSTDDEDDE